MILVIALGGGCLYGAGKLGLSVRPEETEAEAQEALFGHRETLYLWYADDTITDYLNSVAVSYNEYQDRVRVVPVYTQGLEYLETINQASLQTQEVPDLYIISNDSLEKAYLAGLACEVTLPEGVLPMTDILPETLSILLRDKLSSLQQNLSGRLGAGADGSRAGSGAGGGCAGTGGQRRRGRRNSGIPETGGNTRRRCGRKGNTNRTPDHRRDSFLCRRI